MSVTGFAKVIDARINTVSPLCDRESRAVTLHTDVLKLMEALHRRDERLCRLVDSILSEKVLLPELEAQLRDMGIDLDALRGCVEAYCREIRQAG